MNREQFLLDRKTGLGGSDIAAIMGISPWRTALDVYNDKISENISKVDSDAMRRGRDLEHAILKAYANKTGYILITNIPMARDTLYPFLIGNIDAKVQDNNIIVEAKTTRDFMSSWNNELPEHYKVQVAHYATITDCEKVDVVVLFGGLDFGYFTYERNEELEHKIRIAAINFWHNHILTEIPPNPSNLEEIKLAYPLADKKKVISADKQIGFDLRELYEIKSDIKNLIKREAVLKLVIQQYMGNAGILESDDYTATLQSFDRNILDANQLQIDLPKIYQDYLKTIAQRRLTVKESNHARR